MLRRAVSPTILVLAVVAGGLASTPWLRVFPAGTMALPLYGAAVLGVLVPVVVVQAITRSLLVSVLVDLLACLVYLLLVVLHDITGFDALGDGLYHGPAQVLTYALPLVSPSSLMVVPVALCWLAGAFAGEILVRARTSLLPHAGWLVSFALAYAGSARALRSYSHGVRLGDALLAGALLLVLGLLRVAQSWLGDDAATHTGEPVARAGAALPVRSLVVGAITTVVVVLVGAAAVAATPFDGATAAPKRQPPVNQSRPVTPLAFVATLRTPAGKTARPVFDVSLDGASSGYFELASVDLYDGDSWSFDRTFRPSGGVIPADADPALQPPGSLVTQRYQILAGPLSSAPWMPYVYRPARVNGMAISVDPRSGMVVPETALRRGRSYLVQSRAVSRTFDQLGGDSLVATSAPPVDTQLPASAAPTLAKVVASFAAETGQSADAPLAYLRALARDLQQNYALAGASASASPGPSRQPAATGAAKQRTGGTSFADVLASVVGPGRTATPEQFATLYALVARSLGVPARVVTGFHVAPPQGSATLPSGSYQVTTAQAWTWVEIPMRGSGWVVVNPSPSQLRSRAVPSVGAAPTRAPTPVPTQNALVGRNGGGHAVAPTSPVPQRGSSVDAILLITGLVVLGLVLAVVLALWLGKLARRRRRRTGTDPRAQTIGAWQESLDMLAESGLDNLLALTSAEVSSRTGGRYGPMSATEVADIGSAANRALFSSTAVIDQDDADAAWLAHARLRRQVRQHLPWHSRLLAALRYRPQGRRPQGRGH